MNRTTAGFSLFATCYDLSGKDVVKVPTVVFHFGRGSDLSLLASNYLIPVNTAGLFCFGFAGTSSSLTIISHIQQQGIWDIFDPVASRVRFVALLGDARLIIIDSGTTLTSLAKDVYDQVANAVSIWKAARDDLPFHQCRLEVATFKYLYDVWLWSGLLNH
uniref:Peptidase A1 domain-containing protein n=1 Tax=Nymphaea colorata TaxID=210225 RepID=A0A5K1DPB3_9MAGN